MITKEQKSTRKVAIVKVITDFEDPYMRIKWPNGAELEVNLDNFRENKYVDHYIVGHGITLALHAKDVEAIRGFVEKTIVETEFFDL